MQFSMTELERWLPVPGYEDLYLCSNYGRIKALPKIVVYSNGRIYKYEEKILAPNYSLGYRTVSLVKNKIKSTHDIHRLVCKLFVPNPDNKPFVNHVDGNRSNNFYKNLEWATNSENQLHAYNQLGRIAVWGESNGQSKLTAEDVKEIRKLRTEGMTMKQIALRYGVCNESIRKIVTGKTWAKLSG